MESIEALNRALFLKIGAAPTAAKWLIDGAIFVANDVIYVIPILLIVMWLWGDKALRNLALKACLVAMIGVGMNQVIGLAWQHPRPFVIGLSRAWLAHAADSSFPSDHMTVFASVGIALLFGRAVLLGVFTLAVGLCVAWSRVYLGLHFPLDMAGAVGVACITYAGVTPLWRRIGSAATQLAVRLYAKIIARSRLANPEKTL